MGAEIIGSALTGGTNLIGDLIGIRKSSYNAHLQEEQNALNREFNAQEAEKQRAWSTNERLAAQQYSTQERLAAQDYQTKSVATNIRNAYSAMRGVGVNPAVFGQGVMASGSSSSPAQSSPAGGASASFNGGISPVVANMPQLLTGAADLMNAFTNSGVGDANIKLMDANARLALQKMYGEEKANALKDLEIELQRSSLPAKIKSAFQDLAKLNVEIDFLHEQVYNTSEDTQLKKLQKSLTQAEEALTKQREKTESMMTRLKGFEASQAKVTLDNLDSLLKSDIELKRSQSRDNNASAETKELSNNISRATNLTDIENALFNSSTLEMLKQSTDKEKLYQELEMQVKRSKVYKNSDTAKKVDAALSKLRDQLGITDILKAVR